MSVVAAIVLGGGGFIAKAKRTDCAVSWEVTLANRDLLPPRALRWLEAGIQPEA